MYSHFCRNLASYFRINADADLGEYRLQIAQVLRGIADRKLYDHWKDFDKKKFDELNNLVYEIAANADDGGRFFGLETLSHDLFYLDFVAKKSSKYSVDRKKIEEQLKLVALLLGHQYCF